jgi:hypothetical protein
MERDFTFSLSSSIIGNKGHGRSDIRKSRIGDWGLWIAECRLYNPAVGQTCRVLWLAAALTVWGPAGAIQLGSPDPALARLFTPLSAPAGTYVVYTTSETVEALAGRLRALDLSPAPGAWQPARPEANGAFGQDGTYDRARLARLFNGKRVTVVRGSFVRHAQRLAYTLVSPYPDASLSRIVDGTMVIEFHVPPLPTPNP